MSSFFIVQVIQPGSWYLRFQNKRHGLKVWFAYNTLLVKTQQGAPPSEFFNAVVLAVCLISVATANPLHGNELDQGLEDAIAQSNFASSFKESLLPQEDEDQPRSSQDSALDLDSDEQETHKRSPRDRPIRQMSFRRFGSSFSRYQSSRAGSSRGRYSSRSQTQSRSSRSGRNRLSFGRRYELRRAGRNRDRSSSGTQSPARTSSRNRNRFSFGRQYQARNRDRPSSGRRYQARTSGRDRSGRRFRARVTFRNTDQSGRRNRSRKSGSTRRSKAITFVRRAFDQSLQRQRKNRPGRSSQRRQYYSRNADYRNDDVPEYRPNEDGLREHADTLRTQQNGDRDRRTNNDERQDAREQDRSGQREDSQSDFRSRDSNDRDRRQDKRGSNPDKGIPKYDGEYIGNGLSDSLYNRN